MTKLYLLILISLLTLPQTALAICERASNDWEFKYCVKEEIQKARDEANKSPLEKRVEELESEIEDQKDTIQDLEDRLDLEEFNDE